MNTIPTTRWLLIGLFSISLVSGCNTFPTHVDAKPMHFNATPGTLFVADGAGNYQMASKAMRTVLLADGYPIDVITHEWSHGHHRVIADQVGYRHAVNEGKKLATVILEYRAAHPERPIFLLGHSAGATITVAALENLPPGIVDRAILLSPSLSTHYDILPALLRVKRTLHVFYSPDDSFYLGAVTRILGTPDRRWSQTAGRVGFRVPETLGKLVQRAWEPADRELGNDGGHYGNYQPDFLRCHVIPLFSAP